MRALERIRLTHARNDEAHDMIGACDLLALADADSDTPFEEYTGIVGIERWRGIEQILVSGR